MLIFTESKDKLFEETEISLDDLASNPAYQHFRVASIKCTNMAFPSQCSIDLDVYRKGSNLGTRNRGVVTYTDKSGKIGIAVTGDMEIKATSKGSVMCFNRQMSISLFR